MGIVDKDQINLLKGAIIVSIVMLFLGIPSGWPYGYYTFLRWVVTGSAFFAIYITYNLKRPIWIIPLVLTALLFNPLAPVYLDKSTWVFFDVVVGGFLLLVLNKIKLQE